MIAVDASSNGIRFKPVPRPPPGSDPLEAIEEVRGAIPLVPVDPDEAAGRVARRVAWVDGLAEARSWVSLLRAIGAVERGAGGLHRTRDWRARPAEVAERFVRRVLDADAVLERLEGGVPPDAPSGSVDAATLVGEGIGPPPWERRHHGDPAAVWRDRLGRLLDWLVLLGLASEIDGGYRAIEPGDAGGRDGDEDGLGP